MKSYAKGLGAALLALSFIIASFVGSRLFVMHFYPFEWLLNLFLLSFSMALVGCGEETLFRRFLMDYIMEKKLKFKSWIAVLLSSMIFGAMHIFNAPWPFALPQAVGAGLSGLCFAVVYKRYGLPAAIVLHAVYDFLVISGILSPVFHFFLGRI